MPFVAHHVSKSVKEFPVRNKSIFLVKNMGYCLLVCMTKKHESYRRSSTGGTPSSAYNSRSLSASCLMQHRSAHLLLEFPVQPPGTEPFHRPLPLPIIVRDYLYLEQALRTSSHLPPNPPVQKEHLNCSCRRFSEHLADDSTPSVSTILRA